MFPQWDKAMSESILAAVELSPEPNLLTGRNVILVPNLGDCKICSGRVLAKMANTECRMRRSEYGLIQAKLGRLHPWLAVID
jgi:hypothetical protein